MRILVLGAGDVGRATVRSLADAGTDAQIEVADRDIAAAEFAASTVPGVGARVLDVTDRSNLLAALGSCDLVLNTVGPFFRFGPPVLRAAIEAGCDYLDICDDPQPTLDMLELDAAAREAGICALIGMGASPGLVNLLAVMAIGELTRADSVVTGWNVDAAQPERHDIGGTSAAVLHGMRQISGEIWTVRDGSRTQRPPLEKVAVTFPGLGTHSCRTFGHPEPLTLHRAFPAIRDSSNVVVGSPMVLGALSVARWALDHTPLGLDLAARVVTALERVNPASPAEIVKPGHLPPVFAVATGLRDGEPATVGVALAQVPGLSMGVNTGVPFATAASMMPDRRRPGVHTPETLIDPSEFLAALAPRCIGAPPPEAMVVITRSWDAVDITRERLGSALLTAFLA